MTTRILPDHKICEFVEWIRESLDSSDWKVAEHGAVITTDEIWEMWDEYEKQDKNVILIFKTPDVLWHAGIESEKTKKKLEKWIQYGETVRVMFDLVNMTAKVLEN